MRWKIFRRGVMGLTAIGIVVCVVLLLNFTAENPTGRRYSSSNPLMAGDTNAIGYSGEKVLAKDLDLPRNEIARQCICSDNYTPPSSECASCFVRLSSVTTYRIPDFVCSDFLAESKNRGVWNKSDLEQITDYAEAARSLGIPLWIFVRVDSVVPQEYDDLAESTGGDVVYYFITSPDYKDRTDHLAMAGLISGTIIFVGGVLLEFRARQRSRSDIDRRTSAIEDAGDFLEETTKRAKEKISDM